MPSPGGFSWINKPSLGAMAQPRALDEFTWLRQQGIQLIISLTEDPAVRSWINEAGLFLMHIPIADMSPPAQTQIDACMAAIAKANTNGMGVAIHCAAGLGRTGTMLACWFVANEGMTARDAIARVRRLRPGSIETDEQEEAITEFARRRKMEAESDVP